jgi:SAM-dependent methyltransferase
MKSPDSVAYYEHHAHRLLELSVRTRNPGELLPFAELLPRRARVLDLGCGAGEDLILFIKAGFEGVGVELGPVRARWARERAPGAEILERNLLFLTLKEGEFDGVWANRSLHHFSPEATQRIVATAFRGLKPRGILGVILYEGGEAFEDREGDLLGPSRSLHPWSEKAACSMIEQSGFRIRKVGRQPADPTRGHSLPSLLLLAEKI